MMGVGKFEFQNRDTRPELKVLAGWRISRGKGERSTFTSGHIYG